MSACDNKQKTNEIAALGLLIVFLHLGKENTHTHTHILALVNTPGLLEPFTIRLKTARSQNTGLSFNAFITNISS